MSNKSTLTFGKGNAKLGSFISTFSLPAGHTCPGAMDCLSKANRQTGKLTDGKQTKFRCFAASAEALYPIVRESRWNNFELVKKLSSEELAELIQASLPKKCHTVRIHVSGDFFNEVYFLGWLLAANNNPNILFYAYTKSVELMVKFGNVLPKNLKLTASRGGRFDYLIDKHNLKCAEVVFSEQEAADKGLTIDHTDELAYGQDKSFALLLHGMQPKGSIAGKALSALRAVGKGGYSKK